VRLESITTNELLDPNALVSHHVSHRGVERGSGGVLANWEKEQNLDLLNFAYDLTPSQYITVVVTEVGMVPPTSVPVIIREVLDKP
jgi:translation initiation factor eIF-2B subunit delta